MQKGGPKPRVTMRMIAAEAGVHISTVSRTLAAPPSKREFSAKELRVLQIAAARGYLPNPNPASLKTHRSRTIGVLVPHLSDTVLATVYDSIERSANDAGYETFVANTHDDPAEQQRRIALLQSRSVDGVILADGRADGSNVSALASDGPPFVLVNRTAGRHVSVSVDDYHGGRQVGEHLAELGHDQIAIVGGVPWASTTIDRVQGCVDGAEAHGVTISPDRIAGGRGFGVEDGLAGIEQLIANGKVPTAIFAANDMAAIGVAYGLGLRGLIPGRDVAIVGYNDVAIAARLAVPLTTVRTPLERMGSEAVRVLLELLEGTSPPSVLLEPTLMVRESSKGTTSIHGHAGVVRPAPAVAASKEVSGSPEPGR